jgi:hypothetical protein
MGHLDITSLLDAQSAMIDRSHGCTNHAQLTETLIFICFDKQMTIFSRVDGALLYSLSISQIPLGFTNLEIPCDKPHSQTSSVADGAVLLSPELCMSTDIVILGEVLGTSSQTTNSCQVRSRSLRWGSRSFNLTQPPKFTLVGPILSYSYGLPGWLLFVICKAPFGDSPTLPWMSI